VAAPWTDRVGLTTARVGNLSRVHHTTASNPTRVVVLVSGAGTNLQALIDAAAEPSYGVEIVAVGADRDGVEGLARAERAGIPTFVHKVKDYAARADWDRDLTDSCLKHAPELVVLAGFMKLTGAAFLAEFGGRCLNTHPALSPSFPGVSGPAEALAYGVKVTGATLFVVDEGVDSGPIVEQTAVRVQDDDDVETLHERIKVAERVMLVECVGRMAREGFTITDRKVRFGQ
jgi:phosphoribosylglycinamide formyltransferase-1